jgi:hypothetical protein
MYINPWLYNNEPYNGHDVKSYFGFVYLITDLMTNRKYIGRKYFWSLKKIKGKVKKSRVESDWRDYYSSNDFIKNEAKKDPLRFKREILHLCESKGKTNFFEIHEQFLRKVLFSEEYYNDQINGKWFKTNIMKY